MLVCARITVQQVAVDRAACPSAVVAANFAALLNATCGQYEHAALPLVPLAACVIGGVRSCGVLLLCAAHCEHGGQRRQDPFSSDFDHLSPLFWAVPEAVPRSGTLSCLGGQFLAICSPTRCKPRYRWKEESESFPTEPGFVGRRPTGREWLRSEVEAFPSLKGRTELTLPHLRDI